MMSRIGLLSLGVLLCVGLISASMLEADRTSPIIDSVLPAANSVGVPADEPITIRFDREVDPATVNANTVQVFGRWSGVATGDFEMEAGNRSARFTPDKAFSAGEAVTVNISREVRGSAGEPLDRGFAWSYWVKAGPGSLDFTEVARHTARDEDDELVQSYGAYAGDLNGDGFADLAVPNEISNDLRVFMNDGAGGYSDFVTMPIPNGNFPSTNEGADFNGDGLIDVAVGNGGNDIVTVYFGQTNGELSPAVNFSAGGGVRGLCIADVEGDGDPDIVTANMWGDERRGDGNVTVLTNDGTGNFTTESPIETRGRGGKTCAAADINNDGVMDLLIGAHQSQELILLYGDGEGSFAYEKSYPVTGRPWLVAAGDLNGDGHLDVTVVNWQSEDLNVMIGDGQGNFTEPTVYPVGGRLVSVDMGDLDGDSDLDVVVSSYEGKMFKVYENQGDGVLINPRILSATASGSCVVIYDRDNDGDLDMAGVDEVDDWIFIYDNPGR